MRIATKSAVLLAAVAMLALSLGVARAQLVSVPVVQHGQDETMAVDNLAVSKAQGKSATNALTTVYDNTSASGLFGVVSTDLSSTWGDELFTTGTGLLSTHKFTIFNAATNAGPLVTATVALAFFDAVTSGIVATLRKASAHLSRISPERSGAPPMFSKHPITAQWEPS